MSDEMSKHRLLSKRRDKIWNALHRLGITYLVGIMIWKGELDLIDRPNLMETYTSPNQLEKALISAKGFDCDLYDTLTKIGLGIEPALMASLQYEHN